MANKKTKQSKLKKFNLSALQGGIPTTDQGVLKSTIPVVRISHNFLTLDLEEQMCSVGGIGYYGEDCISNQEEYGEKDI